MSKFDKSIILSWCQPVCLIFCSLHRNPRSKRQRKKWRRQLPGSEESDKFIQGSWWRRWLMVFRFEMSYRCCKIDGRNTKILLFLSFVVCVYVVEDGMRVIFYGFLFCSHFAWFWYIFEAIRYQSHDSETPCLNFCQVKVTQRRRKLIGWIIN